MKKLLVYLNGYKKECVLAPLFKMLEATFELFVPLVVAAIIDTGIGTGDRTVIIQMCIVMVVLGVVGLICSVTAQFFAAKAAVGFSTKLRHALFAHIQGLSFAEMDEVGTSTLITRMTSDINQTQSGVNMVLRLFLRSPFIVFGAMIMAFTVDAKAALIFVVAIPLLSVVVFSIMLLNIPLYKKVQGMLDGVLGVTRENLTGARVIRAFHMEEREKERFHVSNEELTRMQLFVGRFSALMNPLTYIIVNGAIVALIWTGAVRVNSGIITQGAVVALVNYMSQILVELVKLANLIITVTKALACANRIQSVFELKSALTDPVEGKQNTVASKEDERKAAEDVVVFQSVGLTYKGAGAESLSDIDFTAKRGQMIGIIGGTGSGKSSLVNLIPRFYDVTRGAVYVDGKDVRDYTLESLRKKIGVVMQKAALFKGTIRENLLWQNPSATEEELWEALEIAQAKEFVEQKEGKLDAVVLQNGKNFSGGQKQRLTIARAVVQKPEILILDDSSSALDFLTDANLRKAIKKQERIGVTFIVSQRTSSIQAADQIIVLDDGEMVGIGTHESLLETCNVYQEIYESQYQTEKKAGV